MHLQLDIAVLDTIVGVRVTTKSLAARINPLTVITPVVLATAIAVAFVVGWNPVAHSVALAAKFVDTISVTQVRAPLAARITSDALARLV